MTNDKTPDTKLKHMTEAAKRMAPEGSHPAARAALRRPRTRPSALAAQYARVERGHEA